MLTAWTGAVACLSTSTLEQEAGLAGQERDLKAAGCEKLFAERVSSVARRDRLQAAIEFVRQGDTLVVTKPDRLERQREGIAKAKSEGRYQGRAPTARRKADEVRALWADGVPATATAERLNIGRSSVYRLIEGQQPVRPLSAP